MDVVLEVLAAFAIIFGIMLGLSVVCATIWACITWLFNREWEWSDKFIIMLEFWSEVISHSSHRSHRHHRSSSSGFKGGSSRGGGAGRSF